MAKGGYRGGMGGGMNMNMIKQAQKMQQDMLKMQEEMESKEYDATAGGGMVKAVVNGKHATIRPVKTRFPFGSPIRLTSLQNISR